MFFLIDIFKEDFNDCEPIVYDQVNSHLQRHADKTQFCFYGECIPPPFPPKLQGWKFTGRTMFFLLNGSSFTSPILTAVTSQPHRSAASISLSLNCFVVWCLLEIEITREFWKLWSRKERKGHIVCIRILRTNSQAVQIYRLKKLKKLLWSMWLWLLLTIDKAKSGLWLSCLKDKKEAGLWHKISRK